MEKNIILDKSSLCAIIIVEAYTLGIRPKLFECLIMGVQDANFSFEDLCKILRWLEFDERIRGDHLIFTRPDVEEVLNIQPKGNHAKPYQVKQVRSVIRKYNLTIEEGK